MITFSELKLITSKLERVEEMETLLQNLMADINALLQKGRLWVENLEEKTYQEMKQLLDGVFDDLIRRCLCIADNCLQKHLESTRTKEILNQSTSTTSAVMENSADNRDDDQVLGQIQELTVNLTSHTKQLKEIRHTINDQDRKIKCISNLKQEMNAQYDGLMTELQGASNFMSNLQTDTDSLSKELNETKQIQKIQNDKVQVTSQKLANYVDSTAKELAQVELLKNDIKRISDESGILTQNLEQLRKLYEKPKTQKDIMKRSVEIAIKRRGLDDKGIYAFWVCGLIQGQSRNVYLEQKCSAARKQNFKDSVSYITEILNSIGLNGSEQDRFWNHYNRY